MSPTDLAISAATGTAISGGSHLGAGWGARLETETRLAPAVPYALAALSGAAFATAFPPLSWSIAAWVALAPLLVACAALSPLRAAVAGMCWTIAAAIGVAGFLPSMLSSYFGLPVASSWLAAVAIVAGLHGLWVSAYCGWVAWLARRRAAHPVLLAGGWLACEFARAHGGLGSPWALAAYSQMESAPVIQIADLGGPYGIGLVIALVNASAAALVVPALAGRRPLVAATTTAALLAGVLVYGHWRLGETFADGPELRVAVVQGGASSNGEAERAARLARYVNLTRHEADPRAELIVWPEYAVEAYLEEASRTRDAVLGVAAETGADLVLGGPHFAPSAAGTRYHNSAYLIRDGHLAARYDKHRLVPFAEESRFAWRNESWSGGYTAGRGSFVLPARGARIGTSLCLEAMFPDLFRESAIEGADFFVSLSNDAWFGGAVPAQQQLDIATLRAVENRRYLVRAAATGFSAVIDAHGRTLARSGFDSREVLNGTVRSAHVRTLYQLYGDAFAWAVIAAVAVATLRSLGGRMIRPQQ